MNYATNADGWGTDDYAYQWGFYGQLRFELTKKLSLILGGRVSRYYEKLRNIAPAPATNWQTTSIFMENLHLTWEQCIRLHLMFRGMPVTPAFSRHLWASKPIMVEG